MSSPSPVEGISVFLPSHNEEGNVERVVKGFCQALPKFAHDYEVIVVDDGSRDRTGEIADRLAMEDSHVRVVHHPVNRGYGGAVTSGLNAARLPYVILCDGDGQFDPAEVGLLTAPVPEYDVVVGRRSRRADPVMRRLNGRAWSLMVRLLFGFGISDIDCGFKLFRRPLVQGIELRSSGAMISTELMARLAGRGARICQVEVHHLPRLSGEQSGANAKVVLWAFVELFRLFRELRSLRTE